MNLKAYVKAKLTVGWNITRTIITICTDNARNITNNVTKGRFENILRATHTLLIYIN